MRLLFWNIGPTPDPDQLIFVNNSITHIDADIVCISEGTVSMANCTALVTSIEGLGYRTFYHPNLSTATVVGGQYDYNHLGLKLFYKNAIPDINSFSFADQQAEGRILHFRFSFNGNYYSCFFIHNMSKAGDEIDQNDFLFKLKGFIDAKRLLYENDKFFIFGDFNLDPWDPLLRHRKTIQSYFFHKEHAFFNVTNEKDIYFNPFLEYIQAHENDLMFGTFHNSVYNSIIDFALFSEGMNNFTINIYDDINGTSMLSRNGTRIAIHNRFDHLPVLITLN